MTLPKPSVATPEPPQIIKGRHYTSSHNGLKLADTIYEDCHFDRINWIECSLSHVNFVNCRFDGNRFERCTLTRLAHENCDMHDMAWIDCKQRGTSHSGGLIHDALWRGESLKDTVFAHLRGARWHFDVLRSAHVSLVASMFEGISISGGYWSDASLIDIEMTNLQVHSARLDNFIVGRSVCRQASLVDCQGTNVRWIQTEIEALSLHDCVLSQAAWSHCKWIKGALESCQITISSFDHASLINVDIRNSELPHSLFDNASIVDCDWRGLRAPHASFRHAQLRHVQLTGAKLPQLDARGAVLEAVSLAHCDCRKADLTGQSRSAWSGADTQQARFDIPVDEDDRTWRQRTNPGARES